MVDINENLRPANTEMTKEINNIFEKSSLKPALFERLDLIELSRTKYSVTS